MTIRWRKQVAARLALASFGGLWLFGCVTDLQARDFAQTTIVRVFWQTIGTALQAAIVDQAASQQ